MHCLRGIVDSQDDLEGIDATLPVAGVPDPGARRETPLVQPQVRRHLRAWARQVCVMCDNEVRGA
jgi:hypothetical protein